MPEPLGSSLFCKDRLQSIHHNLSNIKLRALGSDHLTLRCTVPKGTHHLIFVTINRLKSVVTKYIVPPELLG